MNWLDNFIFIFQGLVVWKTNLYEWVVVSRIKECGRLYPDVLNRFYKILKMLAIPWSTLDFTDHKKVISHKRAANLFINVYVLYWIEFCPPNFSNGYGICYQNCSNDWEKLLKFELYIPSTLNTDYLLWHIVDYVCSKILNHGLLVIIFTFKYFGWKNILN